MNRLLYTLVLLGAVEALGDTQIETKGITNLLQYEGTFNENLDDGLCWYWWNPKEQSGRCRDYVESIPPPWVPADEIADSAYSACRKSYNYNTANGWWRCGNGDNYDVSARSCVSNNRGAGNDNPDLALTDILLHIWSRGDNNGGNC